MNKNEQSLRCLWDITKYSNICMMGVPEGEIKTFPDDLNLRKFVTNGSSLQEMPKAVFQA